MGSPSDLKKLLLTMFLVVRVSPQQVLAVKVSTELGHINPEAAYQVPRSDLNLTSAGVV